MKFTILKEDLCKSLKKVIGGIGVGGSKDTDYLKITASSEGVEFMTTGSLVGIKTRIDGYVTVVEEGECCTSCKKALDMASLMPEGMLTVRQEERGFFIESDRCRLKGEVGELENVLPFLEPEGEEQKVTINAYTFKQMVTDVLFACMKESTSQPQMSSVYFEIKDSSIQVTALDGHQIAVRMEDVKPTGIQTDCMIRASILTAILPLIPLDLEKEISLVIGKNRFFMSTDTEKVSGALTNGKYFDCSKLFPKESPVVKINIEKNVLMDTVNRCAYAFLPSSVATPKPTIFNINRTINIHMDGKVTVDEELAADIEGDPLKIGVSPSLMKGILKAYPNEEMEIYFYGRRSPIVFMGNTAKFLLLPVNIQD